jgi:hypothetical protein
LADIFSLAWRSALTQDDVSSAVVLSVSRSDTVSVSVDGVVLGSELDLRDILTPSAVRSDWACTPEVVHPENPHHQSAVAAEDDSDCVHLLPRESDPDSVAAENS